MYEIRGTAGALLEPDRLWRRDEVLDRLCPVPTDAGLYAWYFTGLSDLVPTGGCCVVGDTVLLYVGIAPSRPGSRQTLRSRLRTHYRGNAEGSTLRLTLGCLLTDRLGLQLRRVGSGTSLTFADGEADLSRWMEDHAFVCWMVDPQPWNREHQLIATGDLPLNLDQNDAHPFAATLKALRNNARATARQLPIVG